MVPWHMLVVAVFTAGWCAQSCGLVSNGPGFNFLAVGCVWWGWGCRVGWLLLAWIVVIVVRAVGCECGALVVGVVLVGWDCSSCVVATVGWDCVVVVVSNVGWGCGTFWVGFSFQSNFGGRGFSSFSFFFFAR